MKFSFDDDTMSNTFVGEESLNQKVTVENSTSVVTRKYCCVHTEDRHRSVRLRGFWPTTSAGNIADHSGRRAKRGLKN